MANGTTSWSYEWNTTTVENGEHTIHARAFDGKEYSQEAIIEVVVVNTENHPPIVSIVSPKNGSTVSGMIIIKGTAQDEDNDGITVEIRIDGGKWNTVTGATSWNYSIDTSKLSNGEHVIYARAYDGKEYGDTVSIKIMVNNVTPGEGGGFNPLIMVGIIAGVVVAIVAIWFYRRK